jgi:hypothetical protein
MLGHGVDCVPDRAGIGKHFETQAGLAMCANMSRENPDARCGSEADYPHDHLKRVGI